MIDSQVVILANSNNISVEMFHTIYLDFYYDCLNSSKVNTFFY